MILIAPNRGLRRMYSTIPTVQQQPECGRMEWSFASQQTLGGWWGIFYLRVGDWRQKPARK